MAKTRWGKRKAAADGEGGGPVARMAPHGAAPAPISCDSAAPRPAAARLTALVLVALLFAASFGLAACGSSPESQPDSTSAAQPAQSGGAAAADAASASDAADPAPDSSAPADGHAAETASDAAPSSSASAEEKALGRLKAVFVDVGQGEANIVEFPDGKTLVIDVAADGGPAANAALAADGIERVDYLLATHPDADHIGGIPDVLAAHEVGQVWAPKAKGTTRTYTRFLQAVKDEGLKIKSACAGKTICEGDGYRASVLWPGKDAIYPDTNDMSAVVLVEYGQTRFLYTGDAPVEALERADAGAVDVLKVSHHGSASGTDGALAASLSPQVAVISYGADNEYGHPAQTVLDALHDAGARVYGTAVNGTVTVTSDGSSVKVKAQHKGKVVAKSEHAGAGNAGLDEVAGAGRDVGGAAADSGGGAAATADASDADEKVYVTPHGKKYHSATCRYAQGSGVREMTRAQAEALGLQACKVCGG